jgi:hypothetical protein
MVKNTRLLILALVFGLMMSQAQAASISLVGDVDSSNISLGNPGSSTTSPKLGYGGGFLIDSMMTPGVGFEIGALYITRKTELDGFSVNGGAASNLDVKTTAIQVPVLLRFHLLPMISIGLGGYWAYGIGNVNSTDTSGNSLASGSYSTELIKQSDFGLLGSVGLRLPLGTGGVKLLIDGRYAYGLTDFNNGAYTTTAKYRDVQGLVGLSFPLHGGR